MYDEDAGTILPDEDDEEEEWDVIVCPDCEGEPSHMPDDCDTCQNEGWTYL